MKKIIGIILAIACLASASVPVFSTEAEETEFQLTLIDENTVFPESSRPTPFSLEESYISEYLPENLQSQGQYGTCWAFSTVALAEISLIRKGLATPSIDLSEAQVAYNVYHEFADRLGLLGNDSLTDLQGTWLEDGGSLALSTWSLAAWKGIAEESIVPYAGIDDSTVLTEEEQRAAYAILTDARWFNMSQTYTVKNMIVLYGAVSASMYHSDEYFSRETNAYYQNVTDGTNHSITVVGWDDNYSASNFSTAPADDGAWICRNSWGSDWGDGGYCYISYYDMAVSASVAYALDFDTADKYDNNYQYDGGLFNGYASLPAGYGYYNTFTAAKNETLEAVGIGLYSADAEYSVMIYDADTGEKLLSEPVEGCTSESGFYTIELPETVSLEAGDRFSVYFSLQTSDGYAHIMIDTSYSNDRFAYQADNSNAESTFTYAYGVPDFSISLTEDYDWCLRIKAYTSDAEDDSTEGDINGDGKANLNDLFTLKGQLLGQAPMTAAADLNGDGKVNISDIFYLRKILLA